MSRILFVSYLELLDARFLLLINPILTELKDLQQKKINSQYDTQYSSRNDDDIDKNDFIPFFESQSVGEKVKSKMQQKINGLPFKFDKKI